MTHTIKILLTESEISALRQSAALDCRRTQDQARYILRKVLLGEQPHEKIKPASISTLTERTDAGFAVSP